MSAGEETFDVTELRLHLLELPELYALLPLFVFGSTPPEEERAAAASPKRPPGDLTVFDLLDDREKAGSDPFREDFEVDLRIGVRRQGVAPTLRGWARRVDAELWDLGLVHEHLVDEATVLGDCTFLYGQLGWVAEQDWCAGLAREVEAMRADMRRVMRESDPTPLVCPTAGCHWQVVPMDARSWFRCTGCNRTWTAAEVVRLYQQQFPMHLSDCGRALSRPLRTLQRWVKDGALVPVGRDTGGALFRLVDVEGAALRVADSGLKKDA